MSNMASFSICIPNYNYSNYIVETIDSLLNQTHKELEICISDNASTDDSIKVIKSYTSKYNFIKLNINKCNVGLYENLKKAANMASNEWMLLLSSDDTAHHKAFEIYDTIIKNIPNPNKSIICSLADCIDSDSKVFNTNKINKLLYKDAIKETNLSNKLGMNVYKIETKKLLKKSLLELRNPLHFATTAYPKALHDQIEGYSWGGIMGPDKTFGYKLLSVSETLYFVESPLFSYRMHSQNNLNNQFKNGGLKYTIDSYVITFNLDKEILDFADITVDQLINSFIKNAISIRILYNLSYFRLIYPLRLIFFGIACYPQKTLTSFKYLTNIFFVILFPISAPILYLSRKLFYKDPTHVKYSRRIV